MWENIIVAYGWQLSIVRHPLFLFCADWRLHPFKLYLLEYLI